MKEISTLLRKVVRLQREEKIIPSGSSLLIAFSGGIDSVVLTYALLELKSFLRIKELALAHFNHMLRGKESDRDEEFCKQVAKSLNLPIFVGKEDVKEIAKRGKKNLEETARELRYAFLRRVKQEKGFDLIATAHHLNDLVETALIWLVRGAGLEGLLGFEPKEGDIVRPLYRVKREEIEAFAKAKDLKWVEDVSNRDPRFFRNRIRLEIVPVFKEVNPNLEETFLRTREILKAEDHLLKETTRNVIETIKIGDCLDANRLKKEHTALQRRVLREFSGALNFSKIEQMRRLLYRGGEVNLGEGLKAVRKGSLICLKKVK